MTGSLISQAMYIHREETGHEVQFKEVWIYNALERNPHLSPECGYTVELRGNTRFQAAQAFLSLPNGDKYVQSLGPKAARENVETIECSYTVGKARKLHPACS